MNVAREKIAVFPGNGGKRSRRGGADGGSPQAEDWRGRLVRNRDQRIESTAHNLLLILDNDPVLAGLFWLDSFANAVMLSREPPWPGGTRHEFTDVDGIEFAAWLGDPDRYCMAVKSDLVMSCVEAVARRRQRHPVRDYLGGLKWDGVPRVARMFIDLYGVADTAYARQAAECFMVSAVARILWVDPLVPHNGAKVDFMLVIEGEQGKGKTASVGALFGAQWYAESMESPSGKDFYQALKGRWCVEIGEMDSFSRADVTKVKQAITSRFDTYRPSYGRVTRSFRRECVFVGTTNEQEYLRDSTGGRRFLPVTIARVDVPAVVAARDQLWAEAVRLFNDGVRWWELPDAAPAEQEKRYDADAWEDVVARWLAGKVAGENAYPSRLRWGLPDIPWVTTNELLEWACCVDTGKQSRAEQMRVGKIMHRLRWVREQGVKDGVKTRYWRRASVEDDDAPPF